MSPVRPTSSAFQLFSDCSPEFINEGHRFNIFQGIGAIPFTYPTAMNLIFYIPPLIASFISASYSSKLMVSLSAMTISDDVLVRTFLALRRSYAQFKEFVSTSSNLNSSRYFRLMALAASDVFLCVPIQLLVIIQSVPFMKKVHWISWEDTHWGFQRVDQFSELQWMNSPTMKFNAYCAKSLTIVACAAFFLFFGFADEAQKHYKMALNSMAKTLRISTAGSGSTTESGTRWGSAVSGSIAYVSFFMVVCQKLIFSPQKIQVYLFFCVHQVTNRWQFSSCLHLHHHREAHFSVLSHLHQRQRCWIHYQEGR